jgi:hypothetical protein
MRVAFFLEKSQTAGGELQIFRIREKMWRVFAIFHKEVCQQIIFFSG